MQRIKTLAPWLLGFLLLILYVQGLPRLLSFEVPHWFAYWFGFFVLSAVLASYLLKVPGLRAFGLSRTPGWGRQLGLGLLLGAGVWATKYALFYVLGKFSLGEMRDAAFVLPMLGQALLAMFFSSLLNDIAIRGYWFAFCRKHALMGSFILLTSLLYAADDAWNGGFTLMNTAFSLILGLSLSFAVYKTGALWLCTGIHWGGNMVYRILNGFTGEGVWVLKEVQEGMLYEWVSLLITAMLFPLLYMLLRNKKRISFTAPAEKQLVV